MLLGSKTCWSVGVISALLLALAAVPAKAGLRIVTLEIANQTGERLSGLEEASEQLLGDEMRGIPGIEVIDNSKLYTEMVRLRLPIDEVPARPTLLQSTESAQEADLLLTGIATGHERSIDKESLRVELLLIDTRRKVVVFRKEVLATVPAGAVPQHLALLRELIESAAHELGTVALALPTQRTEPLVSGTPGGEGTRGLDAPGETSSSHPTDRKAGRSIVFSGAPLNPRVIQLGKRRVELQNRLPQVLGRNQLFRISGDIVERLSDRLTISGSALPITGSPSDMGSHLPGSCLIILNPEASGYISYSIYTGAERFYLGEGRAQNEYGTWIACSKYGDLPESLREPVRLLHSETQEVERKIATATALERQLLAGLRASLRASEFKQESLVKEQSVLNSGKGIGSDTWSVRIASLVAQEHAAYDEAKILQEQIDHLTSYLEAISRGDEVQSRSELGEELEAIRSRRESQVTGATRAELVARRNSLLRNCDDVKAAARRSADVFQGNMAAPKATSDYKQRATASFEQERASFEAQIAECSAEISEIDRVLAEEN